MRFGFLVLVLVVSLSPTLAYGQARVEPLRPAAGSELRVQLACAPPNTPVLVLGTSEISGVGSDADWRFRLPPTLEAKAYPLRWKCGAVDPSKELPQIALIEVSPVVPRVTGVSNFMRDERVSRTEAKSQTAEAKRDRLKDVLKVKVAHLAAWRLLPGNSATPLHVYLAGTELETVVAEPTSIDPGDAPEISALRFALDLDDTNTENRRAWVQVLKAALEKPDRTIDLTVGPSGAPFPSEASISLDVFPSYTWVVGLFLGLVALLVVVLGKRSNLLRDPNGADTPPYSLAKHQMAIWFVVVVGSYVYVWLITGTFSSISTTALTLIGISGATGLVAMTMDNSKREEAVKAMIALRSERDALQAALNDPGGLKAQLAGAAAGSPESQQLMSTITVKQTRLNELNGLLAVPVPGAKPSRRWYLDLLSDDSGVSFHRLQMAVWTVVLATVFLRAVYADILMPEFDATLLGLLGISSGTYLGFKFPAEQK